jgi:hypothetical protein
MAGEMMKPYGGAIEVWEVGRDVGNVRNNKPRPRLTRRICVGGN